MSAAALPCKPWCAIDGDHQGPCKRRTPTDAEYALPSRAPSAAPGGKLETPREMAGRLHPRAPNGSWARMAAGGIRERDAAILARLGETAAWWHDERRALDKLNALRAELRGGQ